ncbi:MAG TPA: hypothetical protein VFO76_05840 [Candidatus Kapabacteria bacterium]|nr:hypothetical protein [Candidatus Kapabacteria bacterium]
MNRSWSIVILFAAAVFASSCATIFNGGRQAVPINAPEGTKVYEDYLDPIPIIDNSILIKRSKSDCYLKLKKNDEEVKVKLESHFQPAWLIVDVFSYGWIVDLITQDWNAFNGIRVHFAGDTVNGAEVKAGYIEQYEDRLTNLHIVLVGGGGYGFPFGSYDQFLLTPNFGIVGAGYEITPRLTALATYSGAKTIDLLSHRSSYRSAFSYTAYQLESRFFFSGNYYATGGFGFTHINSKDENPKVDVDMALGSIGIGIAAGIAYVELRHTFGFTTLIFPNKELGRLGITAVNMGLNLRF